MHHQAGVRTVVAGGRPETGPMQAVGSSRGAESYDAVALDDDIDFAETVNTSVADVLPDRSAGNYINYASFNLKDAVRQGEDLPLQFAYEAATCRIFYTTRTVYSYIKLWNYVVDAVWRNPSLCISGSANDTSANESTNTTGPAVNDKATVAGPDANVPDLILSGLQSGPQKPPSSQPAKRDSPPPTPTYPDPSDLPLHHVLNDGLINVNDCQACNNRNGFTCASAPLCNFGKLEFTKRCVRTCTKSNDPCSRLSQGTQFCFLTGASGVCVDNRDARILKQCKSSTKGVPAQQTRAVGGGVSKPLPYGIRTGRGGRLGIGG